MGVVMLLQANLAYHVSVAETSRSRPSSSFLLILVYKAAAGAAMTFLLLLPPSHLTLASFANFAGGFLQIPKGQR